MKARSERRRSPRTPGCFPLRYRLIPVSGGEYLEGSVEDLSLDGVRFSCAGAVRARSGLLFEMSIPGSGPVRSFARVAWAREVPGGQGRFEAGGRFVDQSTATRKAIERHLAQAPAASGG